MTNKALVGLLLLGLLGCQPDQALEASHTAQDLRVEQAWVRPLPPGMSMTAAYAALENQTATSIELCAVTSPSFRILELHRTEVIDGVARMRQQHELILAPGQRLMLEPGGLHLMLIQATEDIVIGQLIEFELTACDGRTWSVSATVSER